MNGRYILGMARPTSFRLPDGLLDRVEAEARSTGVTLTALVASLLDEGLVVRRFPGIVYRDGATGRRAALAGGPDVWEVIRDLRTTTGEPVDRVSATAAATGLMPRQVQNAIDFYVANPDAIDEQIADDEAAAARVRLQVERRARLLSS